MSAAVAEADRSDPQWRIEELENGRKSIVGSLNSAIRVQAVSGKLPREWPSREFLSQYGGKDNSSLLTKSQTTNLRRELLVYKNGIRDAQELSEFPEGRFAFAWTEDLISTPLPHLDDVRKVTKLLALVCEQHANEGDAEQALASFGALVNTIRSIGDEPILMSQMVRWWGQDGLARATERVLGLTEPSDRSLAQVGTLLQVETTWNGLLVGARAERATWHHILELLAAGKLKAPGQAEPGDLREVLRQAMSNPALLDPKTVRESHAWLLLALTRFVEVAKLPPERQLKALSELEATFNSSPPLAKPLIPNMRNLVHTSHRVQAELRCSVVALALERHRRKEKRWPESLDQLVPTYLQTVPTDPFTGGKLLYGRRDDGVVVYATGTDLVDNGGTFDEKAPNRQGSDIGLRLWDVKHRRKPAD